MGIPHRELEEIARANFVKRVFAGACDRARGSAGKAGLRGAHARR
jgi:hypothetical protein